MLIFKPPQGTLFHSCNKASTRSAKSKTLLR